MVIWIVYCLSLIITTLYADEGTQYECGAHGRFEYCIDDIPGCVIGCHCHPGFYFDTDTKICEASAKLTQQLRRSFISEPTPPQYYSYSIQEETVGSPTPTTLDPINGKVDEITKDADDLGDWLYNQFFKTIENQVINNTNGDIKTKTRRSNNPPPKKKPKRKSSRKYWQRSSKKKGKKHGLRKKLLRITEDDSLFDSSSDSDDDSSSETDSSLSSSSSCESDKKENDHGHKKFIFFNKSQKPPLPSFIFLPGMDTPFYPPIGLPPPPALPMYPIVPVPPMPVFPHPPFFTPHCDDDAKTTQRVSSTTLSSLTDTSSTSISTTIMPSTDSTTESTLTSPAPEPNLRKRVNDKRRGKLKKNNKKLLRHLPDSESRNSEWVTKSKRKKLKNVSNEEELQLDQMQEAEEPVIDYSSREERPPFTNQLRPRYKNQKHNRFKDVDFRYLSELIHRAELNNSNINPEILSNINDKMISPLNGPLRLRFQDNAVMNDSDQREHRRSLHRSPDESYYTNLGREIASLIRKIDSKGERQVNIEIEQNKYTPIHPVMLESRFIPHTLWERYARSPMNLASAYYNNEANYYKITDENLFDLENKVEVFATTISPLSLNELENIISTMKKAKNQIANTKIDFVDVMKPSNKSLNIHLLRHTKHEGFEKPKLEMFERPRLEKNYVVPNYIDTISENVVSTSQRVYVSPSKPNKQWPISDLQKLNNWLFKQNKTNQNQILPKIFGEPYRYIQNLNNRQTQRDSNNEYNVYVRHTTRKPHLDYNQVNPAMFSSPKYFTNNNNQYVVKQAIPFHLYPAPSKMSTIQDNYVKPSYFHHEINHYDVFDQF